TLAAAYDLGSLVPFIGSGMSVPVCANWEGFVKQLEVRAHIKSPQVTDASRLIQRAQYAVQRLRREGTNFSRAVRDAVYLKPETADRTHADALARLHWPLVCSTNYDDVYINAVEAVRKRRPRVLGRSEIGCRQLL